MPEADRLLYAPRLTIATQKMSISVPNSSKTEMAMTIDSPANAPAPMSMHRYGDLSRKAIGEPGHGHRQTIGGIAPAIAASDGDSKNFTPGTVLY